MAAAVVKRMGRKNKSKNHRQKQVEKRLEEENLDRFAGSSDEGGDDFDGHNKETSKQSRNEEFKDDDDDDDDDDASFSSDLMMKQQRSKGRSPKGKGDRKKKVSSSDADRDDDSKESSDDERRHKRRTKTLQIEGDGHDGDLEESSESESDSEEEDELGNATKGPAAKMADAMARILGTGNLTSSSQVKKKTSTIPVILSKTTTPLQRQALKEKKQLMELKAKRVANRERNLSALHIPLSVATTVNIVDSKSDAIKKDGNSKLSSITEELEQERLHRRVATRGVVALFNAISQHQKGGGNDNDDSSDEEAVMKKRKNNKDSTKLTKHGFLEKLKSKAAAAANKGKTAADNMSSTGGVSDDDTDKNSNNAGKATIARPQWNALKDDYMLNPKKVR